MDDNILDQLAQMNGFESIDEMNRLVCKAAISTHEDLAFFKDWQEKDGTKAGLLKLISAQGGQSGQQTCGKSPN